MSLSVAGDRWRCNKQMCCSKIGDCDGTWLEGSRVDFQKVAFFNFWCSKELISAKFCHEEKRLMYNTSVDWNKNLREVLRGV